MRIALLTEIPAPFRIPLFNALAGLDGIDLQVLFLSRNDPRRDYPVYESEFRFDWEVLPGRDISVRGRWIVLNADVRRRLRPCASGRRHRRRVEPAGLLECAHAPPTDDRVGREHRA